MICFSFSSFLFWSASALVIGKFFLGEVLWTSKALGVGSSSCEDFIGFRGDGDAGGVPPIPVMQSLPDSRLCDGAHIARTLRDGCAKRHSRCSIVLVRENGLAGQHSLLLSWFRGPLASGSRCSDRLRCVERSEGDRCNPRMGSTVVPSRTARLFLTFRAGEEARSAEA
jgi:hypothetical protein